VSGDIVTSKNTVNAYAGLLFAAALLMAAAVAAAPGDNSGNKGGGGPKEVSAELTFTADKAAYVVGDQALLTWDSTDTKFCSASGNWSGKLPTSGSYTTPALEASAEYSLKCAARGGGVEQTLLLTVTDPPPPAEDPPPPDEEPIPPPDGEPLPPPDEEPAPPPPPPPAEEPLLEFTVDRSTVDSGGDIQLSWNATYATSCQAEGGWFGTRSVTGSEQVGPVYARSSYALTCTGDGGSVLGTVEVLVNGTVALSWVAPTENVDGTRLTDLASFKIYVGDTSRAYTDVIEVPDPSSTSHELELVSGTWYVAMTACDADGNESAYSNEVEKSVP
jgi:hypothetical protein